MNVEISESTYQAITQIPPDVGAFLEAAARERLKSVQPMQKLDAKELIERFRKFRGMLKGVSLEQLIESIHEGHRY